MSRNIIQALALSTFALTAIGMHGQSAAPDHTWFDAQAISASEKKLDVITIDHPERRHGCRIKSITPDRVVCSRAFGRSRTYMSQQVLALIATGDGHLATWLWIGFNGAAGASIWATVVLAATCPVCAAATGVAAVAFFGMAGAVVFTGSQKDRLVYLAPGQQLTGKLHALQP